MNPTVLICSHNRLEITSYNIESLFRQSVMPKIVLCISQQQEFRYFKKKYPSILVTRYPNMPLGAKWQYGVQVSSSLNPNPLIILGSDDILGQKYIENCTKLTLDGIHFIGLQRWFIHYNNTAYLCDYLANQPLGGGRCYSAELLKKLDYQLFDTLKNRHLDDHPWNKIRTSGLKVKWVRDVEKEGLLIHAIKGNWPVMNKVNLTHKNIKVISTHDSKTILRELPGGF